MTIAVVAAVVVVVVRRSSRRRGAPDPNFPLHHELAPSPDTPQSPRNHEAQESKHHLPTPYTLATLQRGTSRSPARRDPQGWP